jgi:oxazoline/thiazoline synthase
MGLNHPTFRPHLIVQTLDDRTIIVRGESGNSILKGRIYSLVCPFLDGEKTPDEIAETLGDVVPASHVYYAIDSLEAKGYLGEPFALNGSAARFWSALGANLELVDTRLSKGSINVRLVDFPDPSPLIAAASRLGLSVTSDAELEVVVVDDYLNPNLAELNTKFITTRKPWLLVKPGGLIPWLGPLFEPSSEVSACWECLSYRLRHNRYLPRDLSVPLFRGEDREGSFLPSTLEIAMNIGALEIAKWLVTGRNENVFNQVNTFNLQTLDLQSHALVRRPQCAACGNPQLQRAIEVRLANSTKLSDARGGFRVKGADETLADLEPFISPITGIVPNIVKWTQHGDSPIHLYLARHRHGTPISLNANRLLGHFAFAGGKGATDVEAKVSCIAEAIERYSCGFQGSELSLTAKYEDVKEKAIHPSEILLFSDRQFENRFATNNSGIDLFNRIPNRFRECEPTDWTPAWSLTRNTMRYLPTAYCYFDYPQTHENSFCWADSNGCASGNTVEECILQGLLELVERDAVAIWWYNRLQMPEVDIDSFGEPYFAQVKRFLNRIGRTLRVIDLTNDLNIPSFCAVSSNQNGGEVLFGLGSHLNAIIGVMRAITELCQMLPFAEACEDEKSNRPNKMWFESTMREWLRNETLDSQPYLIPSTREVRTSASYIRRETSDLCSEILSCIDRLASFSLETIVLDMSRADLPLHTVRVTVPGLRHFWARFAPGRLFDVPVKQGWLEEPVREQELNPIAYFL